MRILTSVLISTMLAVLATAPMANTAVGPVSLPHDEFMPEDIYGLRIDRPDQVLFEIRSYRLTLGSEARGGGAPAVQVGAWLHLEGAPQPGAVEVAKARVVLVEPGARLRAAQLDARSGLLTLYYPQSMLEPLLALLAGPGPHYVQGRFHANGTVWADIHAGPVILPR